MRKSSLYGLWKQTHMLNKCLMLIMLIMLLQSAASIFMGGVTVQMVGNIDVVTRTSSAAIFGYFLGDKFIIDGASLEEATCSSKQSSTADKRNHSDVQSVVIVIIGVFCLIVLLTLRNMMQLGMISELSGSAASTITQFRDFVSGCVGFLIGGPRTSGANK